MVHNIPVGEATEKYVLSPMASVTAGRVVRYTEQNLENLLEKNKFDIGTCTGTVTKPTTLSATFLAMTTHDFELGMNNVAAEPFVDVALMLTACSFTLLVGIIIGYYVETLFKGQKIFGKIAGAPSTVSYNGMTESEHKDYEAFGGGPYSSRLGRVNLSKNSLGSKPMSTDMPEAMLLSTKPQKIPKHIAVIMDGNRRFGKQKHGNSLQGHWAGGQTLVDFIQWCKEDGVQLLTAYAFSTENWNRDPVEVQTLMAIFAQYAEKFRTEALAHNVKVNVLSSDPARLPDNVRTAVAALEAATAHCSSFTVNICLSYGSRGEIVNACRSVAAQVQAGQLAPEEVDEGHLQAALSAKGDFPDPDILIRTSGEHRLSNFLLWQLAYTELFFVDKLWPQLTRLDYRRIVHQYASQRSRRFGV